MDWKISKGTVCMCTCSSPYAINSMYMHEHCLVEEMTTILSKPSTNAHKMGIYEQNKRYVFQTLHEKMNKTAFSLICYV